MDLGAYANIELLEEIAKKNGIKVPRLRGYRLMKNEEPMRVTKEDMKYISYKECDDLCHSIPFWGSNARAYIYCRERSSVQEYYIDDEKVRWDRIHGWKRKVLKTAIHNQKKRIEKQNVVWNKYVGRDDILYIHARIGGGNWPYYYEEVVNEPWFIEKVDDAWDSTYCDIYARIRGIYG